MLQGNDISVVKRLRDGQPAEYWLAVMRCCPA